jgi:2-polyprenyl-3-methyl-5-hydroxy-6-metoxy-1,4-benzoquinol methylase
MQQPWSCESKIPSFAAKLGKLNLDSLDISDYSRRYLSHLVAHRLYYLAIYAEVLDNLLRYSSKKIEEISVVDYGAGNGLLGIFAKHCGARQVILCDQDAEFVDASRLTATALSISVERFVTGEIDVLAPSPDGSQVDAVIGTDVIEHIYNLDDFFAGIKKINGQMVTVFTTASNPGNYFKIRQLKKLQIKDELEGSDPEDFLLAGAEKHDSFLQIRERIIRSGFPGLRSEQYNLLAKQTRGLSQADIYKATTQYLAAGDLPIPDATSNTCHPVTGSWTERVLPLKAYEGLYKKYGFRLEVRSGFYNDYETGSKRIVNKIRNLLIKLTGKNTAPFITLIGYKTP